MDIDIILEPDLTADQITELAVAAERAGIRALWSSNYHQHRDCLLSLVPAAIATNRILLGPLALSPWEMHPLKMANAMLTLNEFANGRAMVAVSGGGGVLGAMSWRGDPGTEAWPGRHPVKGTRYPDRRVRGVRDCIETLNLARAGKMTMGFTGGVFEVNRPFQMDWAGPDGPLIYGCCNGPMMVRMGTSIADGIQYSDFTVEMLDEAMPQLHAGLQQRPEPIDDFRIGNFWAWHIKKDRDVSMYEARRELIWRGAVIGKMEEELEVFCHDEAELNIIMDNWDNFRKANWTRSGKIDGVPADLVNRLIAGLASAGDMADLDQEIERYRAFAKAGLTELSLRLHDEPMEALELIGKHVVPAVH